jgi:hypothetical protein
MNKYIEASEKYLHFKGLAPDAITLIDSLHGAYYSSDMPKVLNDFVFNLEVALQNAGIYDQDFNLIEHKANCPAVDGFGCRCEEEACRYCGGNCPNDEAHACDGYLGDIDNLYGEVV